MRVLFVVLGFASALTVAAQQPASPTPSTQQSLQTPVPRAAQEAVPYLQAPKANEMIVGGHSISGIAVEARKVNPLQLINPLAPSSYGSAVDNTAINPINGEAEGLKLFSFRF